LKLCGGVGQINHWPAAFGELGGYWLAGTGSAASLAVLGLLIFFSWQALSAAFGF